MMIVLVIIGVIAGLAIPSMMESRTSGNETSAEKALEGIVEAEATFFKTDYDGDGKDFSFNLANLYDRLDGNGVAIALIDPVLKTGLKGGYAYGACTTWDAAGSNDNHGFAYYAVPETYKQTGRKSYVVNHEGILFYKDTGSNAAIGNWPDPLNDPTWTELGK